MADAVEKTTADAFAAVAIEGRVRHEPGPRKWLLLCSALITLCFASYLVYYFVVEPFLRARQDPLPVAVLFPKLDSPVGGDARRQCEGFRAFADKQGVHRECEEFIAGADKNDMVFYHFDYPFIAKKDPAEGDSVGSGASLRSEPSKSTQELVMDQIKTWYREDEIRIYIITMSGAVKNIRTEFNDWAEKQDKDERPVLIATVASAPKIVEDTSTVFRYYIRSRDETDVFSTYIETVGANEVFIFYIDDGVKGYGVSGKNTFKKRLDDKKINIVSIKVPIHGPDVEVIRDFKAALDDTLSRKSAIAIIVGYGSMINNTLDMLRTTTGDDGPHEGKILITSAFTEKEWRPKFSDSSWDFGGSSGQDFAKRIYSVGPNTTQDDDDKKGVVYQFSYLTLERAAKCSYARGIEEFKKCWFNNALLPGTENWVKEIEFTEDGDSHVSLKLLKEQW